MHKVGRGADRRFRSPRPPPADVGAALEARSTFTAALRSRLALPAIHPGGGLIDVPPFTRHVLAEDVVEEARRLTAGEISIFGTSHPLPEGTSWHRDPVSGFEWPQRPYWQLPISPGEGIDIKRPWEAARFHHLAPLLEAYLLTGNSRWADAATRQILDFIDHNPRGMGVHWAGAMEVAIRAANWSYALVILLSGDTMTTSAGKRILAAIHEHASHVRRELSWNPHSRGNHYLCELVGLLVAGLTLGHRREGQEWVRFAAPRIVRESGTQIRGDGTNWESSTGYHRFVAELFAHSCVLLEDTSVDTYLSTTHELRQRVSAMGDVVRAYTRPDGTAPLIGDVDDSRLFAFGMAGVAPARHAARLRPYFDLSWDPALKSVAFDDSGWFVLRGEDAHVMLRCGPVGLRGRGAHDHADQLAVDVTLAGTLLFVDAGTPVYTGHREARQRFRSTAVHNTATVDGVSQVAFSEASTFEVETGASVQPLAWTLGEDQTVFEGEHFGYERLAHSVVHRRWVRLAGDGSRLTIVDTFEGPAYEHEMVFTFQCACGSTVESETDGRSVVVRSRDKRFLLCAEGAHEISLKVETGAVSSGYGTTCDAPAIRYTTRARVPFKVTFDIMPLP